VLLPFLSRRLSPDVVDARIDCVQLCATIRFDLFKHAAKKPLLQDEYPTKIDAMVVSISQNFQCCWGIQLPLSALGVGGITGLVELVMGFVAWGLRLMGTAAFVLQIMMSMLKLFFGFAEDVHNRQNRLAIMYLSGSSGGNVTENKVWDDAKRSESVMRSLSEEGKTSYKSKGYTNLRDKVKTSNLARIIQFSYYRSHVSVVG
jgi:hypothetical protein